MNKKEMRYLLSEAVEKWNPKKDKESKDTFFGGAVRAGDKTISKAGVIQDSLFLDLVKNNG